MLTGLPGLVPAFYYQLAWLLNFYAFMDGMYY